jgi:hypothetical protein
MRQCACHPVVACTVQKTRGTGRWAQHCRLMPLIHTKIISHHCAQHCAAQHDEHVLLLPVIGVSQQPTLKYA